MLRKAAKFDLFYQYTRNPMLRHYRPMYAKHWEMVWELCAKFDQRPSPKKVCDRPRQVENLK